LPWKDAGIRNGRCGKCAEADEPVSCVLPFTENEPLDGSKHSYILHFDKEELPPVDAFWSLTLYILPEQLFFENEIHRYKIGSETEGLKYNDDGLLDIYIQKDNPRGTLESNWLPSYNGDFFLQARRYCPKQEVLELLYAHPVEEKQ